MISRTRHARMTRNFKFKRRFKLKYLFLKRGLNLYKTSLFFDFQKFTKRKWKFLRGMVKRNARSRNLYFNTAIRRYNIFCSYSKFSNDLGLTKKLYIIRYFNLRKKNFIINKLSFFFFLKGKKLLKKKILGLIRNKFYKRTRFKGGTLNSRIDIILYQLGCFSSMLDVMTFLDNNFLIINNKKIKTKDYFLNNFDRVKLNFNESRKYTKVIYFNSRFKRFFYYSDIRQSSFFLLYTKIVQRYLLKGLLPFNFPINLQSFSFIFFKYRNNFLLNFNVEFFEILKFLKYGR